jgi:hypothetical protein
MHVKCHTLLPSLKPSQSATRTNLIQITIRVRDCAAVQMHLRHCQWSCSRPRSRPPWHHGMGLKIHSGYNLPFCTRLHTPTHTVHWTL